MLEETSISELPGVVKQTPETSHKNTHSGAASIGNLFHFPDSLPNKGFIENPFSHLLAPSQSGTPRSSSPQASDHTQNGKLFNLPNNSESILGIRASETASTKPSDGELGSTGVFGNGAIFQTTSTKGLGGEKGIKLASTLFDNVSFQGFGKSTLGNATNGSSSLSGGFEGSGLKVASDSKPASPAGRSSPAPNKTDNSTK